MQNDNSNYLKEILLGQYEASLAMMKQRIEVCPPEYWDGKVGRDSLRQTVYHALFFLDLYLAETEEGFVLRELHNKGGDDSKEGVSPGLSIADTLLLVELCHKNIHESLAKETEESLRGESGFSWRKHSRGELHIYNIRHVQHHVGQISTCLRKISDEHNLSLKLDWVGSGWR